MRRLSAALLFAVPLLSLFPAGAATPPFSFFARRDIVAGFINSSFASVAVADFNGDGRPDLAAVDFGQDAVVVLLAQSDGSYVQASYPVGFEPEIVVAGDFNHGGHPDLAVSTFESGLSVLINRGDGTFAPGVSYASGGSMGLATADFDGDGNLDLVGESFIMLGIGDGTFERAAPLVRTAHGANKAAVSVGNSVVIADFNGDGKPDVAVADDEFGQVDILLGNGNGTFQRAKTFILPSGVHSVAAGDFNEDGIPDLAFAVSGETLSEIVVTLGKGNGTFGPQQVFGAGPEGAQSIVAADFNGDGHLDLAVADRSTSFPAVAVLPGDGHGSFGSPLIFPMSDPFSVTAVDLNGDGHPDILIANASTPVISVVHGSAKFSAYPNLNAGIAPEAAAVGDFNGDGKQDLAVTGSASNDVSILLGNGAGGFVFSAALPVGLTPIGVIAGDFNGDGKLDLAVVNRGLDNVSILLGNGDGTFRPAVNFGAGVSPFGIAKGDLNHDGKLDLVVANTGSGNISVLLGNGDGTFRAPVNYVTGDTPTAIAVGDLNGDGKLDLAVTNFGIPKQTSGTVSVLLGNGDGTFQTQSVLSSNVGGPFGIAIADMNGDSKPDMVVANFHTGTVAFYAGRGDGTFNPPALTTVGTGGSGPSAVIVHDFNGDGKADIAVVLENQQDVALIAGDGSGGFGQPVFFGAGFLPVAMAAGLFHQGGHGDLAVVNQGTSSVSVLLNLR